MSAGAASRGKPTDDAVLAAVRQHAGATYVVTNVLRFDGYGVETPWVLRRLKALERAGLVQREASGYAVMISWGLTAAGRDRLGQETAPTTATGLKAEPFGHPALSRGVRLVGDESSDA